MNILNNKQASFVVWGVILLYVIYNSIINGLSFYKYITDVQSFELTEFLINYTGGYVRRGLFGELLLWFTSWTKLDPRWVIVPMCIIVYIGFIFIIFNLCRKTHSCSWIMIFILFHRYAFHGIVRKDYLIFLLFAFIIYFLFLSNKIKELRVFLALVIYLISINIHECTFFIAAPFLMLYLLRQNGCWKFDLKRIIALLIVIGGMLLVSIHKGSFETAQTIHNSWVVYFDSNFGLTPSGSIQALSWTTKYAFDMHMNINYFMNSAGIISGWIYMLIMLAGLFYIVPNITLLYSEKSPDLRLRRQNLLFLILMQMVSLLPMFTFLSCDIFRITSYWIVSTMLLYTIIRSEELKKLIPQEIEPVLLTLERLVFHSGSRISSVILLLVIGIPFTGYNVLSAMSAAPLMRYYFIIKNCKDFLLNYLM